MERSDGPLTACPAQAILLSMSTSRISALILALSALLPGSLAARSTVPPERLALLARGINLSELFSPWTNPASFGTRFRPEDADFIKRAGFTVCRLPLGPDLLFDPAQPAQPKAEIRYVDRVVRLLLDAGVAVVFDPIHGDSANSDWEKKLAHNASYRAKAETYWESLARHYAAFSTDRIFFEVMNEPHLSSVEKGSGSWWEGVQRGLAAAIRRGAPDSTIIATGENWGSVDGLLAIEPLADANVVYSFHFYDPMTFTHQGAGWTGPVQVALRDIPYPSNPTAVAHAAAALKDSAARAQVLRYGEEQWDAPRIASRIKRAADWGKKYDVPLFCGEFGVYRKVSPASDRLAWITDVRRSLEFMGIGWAMWDYDGDFGVVGYDEPSWRRGPKADSGNLAALGLDSSQSLAPKPGEATVAELVTGARDEIEIPIDAWGKLWTRGKGAGGESYTDGLEGSPPSASITNRGALDWALSTGLRIPVALGEALELSSRASREGRGSLKMEFVARDAADAVVDWSYGSVAVPAGPMVEVAAKVVVEKGIATLEPRWSGKGPVGCRVEAFRLKVIGRP